MKRIRWQKASVFRQYMLSYFSVALLAFCLIGILFYQAMARQMLTTQLEMEQKKLDQIVEDFQIQLDLLEGISHQISIGLEFRPTHFRSNKYYELELLQSLSRFVNVSPFASDYFLYYYDDAVFYRATGRSSDATYFISQYLQGGPDDLLPLLQTGGEVIVLNQPDQSQALLLYPVRTSGVRQGEINAVLCFILTEEELENRLTAVTGGIEGALHIRLDTYTLLQREEKEISGRRYVLDSATSDGAVHADLEIDSNDLVGGRSLVRIINTAAAVVTVLLLLSAVVFFAWRSYFPIHQIYKHVRGQEEESRALNEFAGIEEAFASLRQSNRKANQALLDQWRLLRSQLLRSLLNGDDVVDNLVRLRLLGIELASPCYVVFFLCLSAVDGDEPLKAIEGLSSETLRLFAVHMGLGNEYAVICVMEEEYQVAEAEELLQAVLETWNESGGMGCGEVYSSPEQITTSYLEAVSGLRRRRAYRNAPDKARQSQDYDPGYLLRLLHEVRAGNAEEISSRLDFFERHLDACAPSLLAQKYIYSQVITLLVQTVGDWGVPLDPLTLSKVLTAKDNHTFREGLDKILLHLAGSLSLQQRGEDDLSMRVLQYLKAHYLDYDLSLNSMAEEFHVTADYLGKLIKGATAVTYKAYVTNLKVEEGKRLLTEGLSVTETAKRLGYSSTSHFIRTFRQIVDITPSAYQKQHKSGESP